MSETKNKQPLYEKLEANKKEMIDRLGIGTTFDVGIRSFQICGRELQLYFVQGLVEDRHIIEILEQLMRLDDEQAPRNVQKAVEERLPDVQVEYKETFEDCITELLSGLLVIFMEGKDEAFIIDVRFYPGRTPEEPDTEKVVRGSRDGYTENIIENTALTRRRVRDERLRNEIMRVGRRSQTDICVSYIDGVADPDLVDIIKKELEAIDVDGLTMADKTVEEFLVKQGYTPFPLVRFTERPDAGAQHLFEGHVLIMVDASPSVIITPTTLFHHIQHAEEHRQAPAVGTYLRWIRFFGMIASLLIVPLWLLFVLAPDMLPAGLEYIGPEDEHNVPIFVQLIFAEVGLELLRMAAIHTPDPLATALGLVAALLIGEIAMEVGLFSAEVILYAALGVIGTYATPSYEFSVSMKMMRLFFIFMIGFFQAPGFVVGATLLFIWLVSIKSLNKPYLWPFLPFDPLAMRDLFVRRAVPNEKVRLRIANPKNRVKQGS
ncbi:stage V sporulation protein AF [Salsuginibacillus halophilus]|uniref:Stage V sporulation protein AF n=1 Tax=Salsuginibacillus halophilus TaxID=517424 RepID=A0A2P8HAR6_9BACI|nr:spore germination protein [Salsuginibacillus halophilus]PSL43307.1 stage V sporulation protein AF [Salsuginibacillus halophilus]